MTIAVHRYIQCTGLLRDKGAHFNCVLPVIFACQLDIKTVTVLKYAITLGLKSAKYLCFFTIIFPAAQHGNREEKKPNEPINLPFFAYLFRFHLFTKYVQFVFLLRLHKCGFGKENNYIRLFIHASFIGLFFNIFTLYFCFFFRTLLSFPVAHQTTSVRIRI